MAPMLTANLIPSIVPFEMASKIIDPSLKSEILISLSIFSSCGNNILEIKIAPGAAITEAVKRCLEQTPPELAADILERGIIVAGGGSLLRGIDQIIRERTNVPVNVAEDPLLSVVKGTGMVLENLKKYEAVLL